MVQLWSFQQLNSNKQEHTVEEYCYIFYVWYQSTSEYYYYEKPWWYVKTITNNKWGYVEYSQPYFPEKLFKDIVFICIRSHRPIPTDKCSLDTQTYRKIAAPQCQHLYAIYVLIFITSLCIHKKYYFLLDIFVEKILYIHVIRSKVKLYFGPHIFYMS